MGLICYRPDMLFVKTEKKSLYFHLDKHGSNIDLLQSQRRDFVYFVKYFSQVFLKRQLKTRCGMARQHIQYVFYVLLVARVCSKNSIKCKIGFQLFEGPKFDVLDVVISSLKITFHVTDY